MGSIKCVIWDLDNTLWDGICLENEKVELKPGIEAVLAEIKSRGIVQSIASKNEPKAIEFVREFGLADYFVYPEISWDPKEDNIRKIVEKLNIGLDAVAFVDDQAFERDSVAAMLPGVRVYDALDYQGMTDLPEFQLGYDTPEARLRGQMYVEEAERKVLEDAFEGNRDDFLSSLSMVAAPRVATLDDLPRISELVTRTNQFNSTGLRYSDAEIEAMFGDPGQRFFITSLVDKYGDYGRCGVSLVKIEDGVWSLEIVLLSCRVAGRGLGTAFLAWLTAEAHRQGASEVRAKYVRTDRNRQIGLLYQILGFRRSEALSSDTMSVFCYPLDSGPVPMPEWISIQEPAPADK